MLRGMMAPHHATQHVFVVTCIFITALRIGVFERVAVGKFRVVSAGWRCVEISGFIIVHASWQVNGESDPQNSLITSRHMPHGIHRCPRGFSKASTNAIRLNSEWPSLTALSIAARSAYIVGENPARYDASRIWKPLTAVLMQ